MEVVGLSLGAFELAFLLAGILSKPDLGAMFAQLEMLPKSLDATHVNTTSRRPGPSISLLPSPRREVHGSILLSRALVS